MCIEDMDHHCVFFSKCIGGGNIYFFWGTIGGVLFNFLNIALMIGVTAAMTGGVDSPSQSQSVKEALTNTIVKQAVHHNVGI